MADITDDSDETDGGDIVWHDGAIPFSPRFEDHYYSRSDGRAECDHVFLAGNGLPERWADTDVFTIGELGFGTGLNMVETWRQWKRARRPGQRLRLVSVEKYPLSRDAIAKALGAWPELSAETDALTLAWPDNPAGQIHLHLDDQTELTVHIGDAEEAIGQFPGDLDAWFLDGFAPARNPQMWSQALLADVFSRTRSGGTFATFTAAGWVRRNLAEAGFQVIKRPGHAGKRDMLAGRRP